MILTRLGLREFRNIEKATLYPSPNINIFFGDNAQGKTNLIEAVYLLANLRGFRSVKNCDFIRHGKDSCRVEAELKIAQIPHLLQVSLLPLSKKILLDEKSPDSSSSYFSHIRTILFSPEEVNLIKSGPAGRRSLIDRAVFISNPKYLDLFSTYRKILSNRNVLLKKRANSNEMEPWNEALIRAGASIRKKRWDFIRNIAPYLDDFFRQISNEKEKVIIDYPQGCWEKSSLEENFRVDLWENRESELRLGQTLSGPHRDDFIIDINGFSLRQFGSQGQQRSFILAFKTAQIREMEKRIGISPILLLDDMTGELDRERQEFLFKFLLERQTQVFLTTTEINRIFRNGFEGARFFRVDAGVFYPDTLE